MMNKLLHGPSFISGAARVHIDAADADSTAKAVETVSSAFGRIDHAVNNVGIPGPLGPSASISTKDFKRLLDVNLTSMWIAQREQIKPMLQQDPVQQEVGKARGTIVNVSSVWGGFGSRDFPSMTAYATSKHGIIGITKSATMKRFAQPEELANSITYLSSWMSSFMSGEAMLVDGGFSS
ncbi:hypothetical protein TgHK011_009846 [Trichoderma gracile]|nr:hypothetical protein TgHK011_009846 [Trichoderma gracile]